MINQFARAWMVNYQGMVTHAGMLCLVQEDGEMSTITDPRPSPIAGVWYNGNKEALASEIDEYMNIATLPDLNGEVVAVIAPHAGYRYSGRTAGYAFRAVRGKAFDLVAVISPYHQFHPADMLTSAHSEYETPLGSLPVDQECLQMFAESVNKSGAAGTLSTIQQDREHSLEIELPFLQRALTQPFSLLPIMLRSRSVLQLEAIGKALAGVLRGRSALLVASTDLSHFYPLAIASKYDHEMLKQIEYFSPQGVLAIEEQGRGFACGGPAVAAVLWAARELGATKARLLHYSTSAEQTGDSSSVVGYGAAAVLRPE